MPRAAGGWRYSFTRVVPYTSYPASVCSTCVGCARVISRGGLQRGRVHHRLGERDVRRLFARGVVGDQVSYWLICPSIGTRAPNGESAADAGLAVGVRSAQAVAPRRHRAARMHRLLCILSAIINWGTHWMGHAKAYSEL